MENTSRRRRLWIGFSGLVMALLVLFFWKGSTAVNAILIFTCIYPVLAFLVVRLTGRHIEGDLQDGNIVDKGEPMVEKLSVRNRGKLPLLYGEFILSAANQLTGEERHLPASLFLAPGKSREISFTLTDDCCGKIRFRAEHFRVTDPLRLFHGKEIPVRPAAGYFAPQIRLLEVPDDYLDSYNMESYQYSQHEKGGDPGQVYDVRDYQEGDSLKQIHWKLTAKLGDLTVKIPSLPIENNIVILLDNLLIPEQEADARTKSQLLELFYSLSYTLLDRQIAHSLGWYDVEMGYFSLHRIQTVDELRRSVPEALECGFDVSETSAVYRYLESQDGTRFSNHFLVTFQEERDLERLEEYGAVKIFRTTE